MENNYTVDNLYSSKLNQFENKEFLNIHKYKNKINELMLKKNLENSDDIEIKIKILENKIIKNENKIKNYFLDNSNDLCNYFLIKQNIENNKNPKKMIYNFFNKNKGDELSNNTKYIESIYS